MGISLQNLDLLSVGVAVAGMLILGFVTFFTDTKSLSNKVFLGLSVVASAWGVVNFASDQGAFVNISFWLVRLVLFFAVWAALFTFTLAHVFPLTEVELPKYYRWVLAPLTGVVAFSTLTSFVLSRVSEVSGNHITGITNGPGIFLFGATVAFLNIGGVVILIRKAIASNGERQKAVWVFLLGVILMLALIMVFNFILPAFFNISKFTHLGALFMFPFIALTAYAILRHHLLNVKVIAAEILAFALTIVSLLEVVLSNNLSLIIFRSIVFILTLSFGILLIRSVRKEVQQREELERLNKQIEEKNLQLEDLSHFKSELLSLASHQIRSPLAAMKGFLQLIIGGSYGPVDEKIKEKLGSVQHSADELIGLINTLLDVRKVEEGKMEYQFGKTDIKALVLAVGELLKPLAEVKKLEFALKAPEHEVWVNADGEKLRQVIQNLTDNAIKYTPAGFVHLELSVANGSVTVSVADSGLGIPADLIPFLFEEFVRDERVKKEIRGTGLGLYIARKIAEAHGGKITAESGGEGKGSTFRLSLPEMK